ncbi:metallophosphoesterase family protein [Terrimonas pollutisoli]|uniref:metallophosphoesterase family protein n=1 Tax=Terrimonas pollutisoli TaxID=3034147 RepID=UPI0023EC55D0|nr:metallophosphoesterase [Terrimonas sp. H1YJ31]
MKRRELIKKMGLGAGAIAIGGDQSFANGQERRKKKVLHVAHITDIHIRPEHNAPARFRKCMDEIKQHRIDFFLNGGDTIYAADYKHITRERVDEQWQIWQACRNELKGYEVHSCLGNHDMWWAAPSKDDAMYGKNHVVKQLDIPHRYYSFDKKGWHFIILDSNNQNAGSLDEEQRKWLEEDLAKLPVGTPVICLSHYPILAVCTILDGGNHTDSKYISELFFKHKDKKITCLSGHIHLQDSAQYNGVNYFCNGALSGFWWEDGDKDSAGKYYYKQTAPGYAIVELFEDGTVENSYYAHQH